jgi:hypothetical protein
MVGVKSLLSLIHHTAGTFKLFPYRSGLVAPKEALIFRACGRSAALGGQTGESPLASWHYHPLFAHCSRKGERAP